MKKIVITVVIILIVAALAVGGVLLFLSKKDKKEAEVPFVEKYNIEIEPADATYQNNVYIYTEDENYVLTEIDSFKAEDAYATFKFYDYSVSEPDEEGYVTHTYKLDTVTPIKFSVVESNSKWYYTYSAVNPILFDYYTGYTIDKKYVNKDTGTRDLKDDGSYDDMKYTELTWEGKTFKVGVSVDSTSKWDGTKREEKEGGVEYTDTCRTTDTITIRAPKDYDGLMIGILKRGSSRESFEPQYKEQQKFLALQKEAEETGEKSDELKKIEEKRAKKTTIFQSSYNEDLTYTNEDYNVIRASEITKKN